MKTYCDPLPILDIPRGKDQWYPYERGMFSHKYEPKSVTGIDFRQISDPTIFLWDNKWYPYPGCGVCRVVRISATGNFTGRSPAARNAVSATFPGREFLLTSWNGPLYMIDTPRLFYRKGIVYRSRRERTYGPALFIDDDGWMYLYAFSMREKGFRFFNHRKNVEA